MRKSTLAAAWYHFRLAIGFVFTALAIAAFPACAEKTSLITAVEPYEWEV